MLSQIWGARIISVRSKTRCKTIVAPGRPTHVSGHTWLQINNLNNAIEIDSSVFQGLSGARRSPKF